MRANLRNAFVIAALAALLSGCSAVAPMADQSVRFNENYADASNRMFLLNTVRAAKAMPLYYTRVQSLTAETVAQTKLGLPFELGPRSSDLFKIAPEVTGTQKDAVALSPLDDVKFTRGVLTPMPDEMLKFYVDQGWTRELLFTVVFDYIRLRPRVFDRLTRQLDGHCESNHYCKNARAISAYLSENCAKRPEIGGWLTFDNNPREKGAEIYCFQYALRALLASGIRVNKNDKAAIEFEFPNLAAKGSIHGATEDVAFTPRSPDAMIFYLGELIRADLEDGVAVDIWSASAKADVGYTAQRLYLVKRGAPDGPVAVKVGDAGDEFWIPATCITRAECEGQPRHRSMQVISLVNQVFGMLKDSSDKAVFPSITVLPN